MYSIEQRQKIGKLIRDKMGNPKQFPCSTLEHTFKLEFGMRVPAESMRRVYFGGKLEGEPDPQIAYAQDTIISLMAKHYKIDVRAYRDTFAVSPGCYFPDSYAFKPYQATWIADCIDIEFLYKLKATCVAATERGGKTDGHDEARLKIVQHHLNTLERYRNKKKEPVEEFVKDNESLPLLPATDSVIVSNSVPVTPKHEIKIASDGNGFSIDASLAFIKQAKAQGFPTTELETWLVDKACSDRASIKQLISSMLGL